MEIPHNDPLRLRLNALIRAYIREETIVQNQLMTREEIIAEIRAIAEARDTAKAAETHKKNPEPHIEIQGSSF